MRRRRPRWRRGRPARRRRLRARGGQRANGFVPKRLRPSGERRISSQRQQLRAATPGPGGSRRHRARRRRRRPGLRWCRPAATAAHARTCMAWRETTAHAGQGAAAMRDGARRTRNAMARQRQLAHSRGSLDFHLFRKGTTFLDWNTRYKIALGVAKGLAYLHEECRECIIHCDLKPENILLDANFHAKVADFGMAKLLSHDFSSVLTTMRGTIGYLAPEWLSGLPITPKIDVYSYGMNA